MRRKPTPPDDFKYNLCPSCGEIIDFTFALRPCADCKRPLCRSCTARRRDMREKSRCTKCTRKQQIDLGNNRRIGN